MKSPPTEAELWERCEARLDNLAVLIAGRHMGIGNPNLEQAEIQCRQLNSAIIELHARSRGEKPKPLAP